MIQLVDPTVTGGGQKRSVAPRLADLSRLKIGLLSNGKANADALLQQTAAYFDDELGCSVTQLLDKGNAGRPAPPELLAELAAESDFLITAVGD